MLKLEYDVMYSDSGYDVTRSFVVLKSSCPTKLYCCQMLNGRVILGASLTPQGRYRVTPNVPRVK